MLNQDKILHFVVGYVLSGIVCLFGLSSASLIVVMAVAVCKEIFDMKHKETHTADWNDFIATIDGGVVAALQFVLIRSI